VDYEGIVIEESLSSPDILARLQILSTEVQPAEEVAPDTVADALDTAHSAYP
jgi:hypothetical protein